MTTTLGEPVYMVQEDNDAYWGFEDATIIIWGHIEFTQPNAPQALKIDDPEGVPWDRRDFIPDGKKAVIVK